MPYFVTEQGQHPDCEGYAVVKQDGELLGCHTSRQDAIDQMVAISIAEGIEPGGSYTEQNSDTTKDGDIRKAGGSKIIISDIDDTLIHIDERIEKVWEYIEEVEGALFLVTGRPESTRQATENLLADLSIRYTRLIMKPTSTTESSAFKGETADELLKTYDVVLAIENDARARAAYQERGLTVVDPADIEARELQPENELRQVNLTPPAYMRAAARQGLRYYEEGLGGDGLVERTIREARAMARGSVTADKWVRLRAWIARHLVDLDSPAARPGSDDYPSAGVVAHLLWGSGPSKRAAQRALAYAEGVVARIEAENEGRAKGEALSKIETRTNPTDIEVREDGDGMTFTGYAAVFDSWSEPLPFREKISRGAFRRSLRSRNDIKFLWNHDAGEILGSTRAGTLTLQEDDRGLRVEATLPNTSRGRDTAELLRRSDIDSMSFGFSVPQGGDTWNEDGTERTLNSVRLLEVSLVSWPAYTATAGTVAVRGLDKIARAAEVDADALADALLKIEDGQNISTDEAEMLSRVINKLAPEQEPEVEAEPQPDLSMLNLKKKKLELLMKGI